MARDKGLTEAVDSVVTALEKGGLRAFPSGQGVLVRLPSGAVVRLVPEIETRAPRKRRPRVAEAGGAS